FVSPSLTHCSSGGFALAPSLAQLHARRSKISNELPMSPHLTMLQWSFLALGAFSTGLSKTGMAGLGVLTVALFANALPPRASTGALLPLLLCADVFGVT